VLEIIRERLWSWKSSTTNTGTRLWIANSIPASHLQLPRVSAVLGVADADAGAEWPLANKDANDQCMKSYAMAIAFAIVR
jgi:hypothetical protein